MQGSNENDLMTLKAVVFILETREAKRLWKYI